jgi:hypothetical protein
MAKANKSDEQRNIKICTAIAETIFVVSGGYLSGWIKKTVPVPNGTSRT